MSVLVTVKLKSSQSTSVLASISPVVTADRDVGAVLDNTAYAPLKNGGEPLLYVGSIGPTALP